MASTKTPKQIQFTIADVAKLIEADEQGGRGSIRRAMHTLSVLGIAPVFPPVPEDMADVKHFLQPSAVALSACGGPGKVTRNGYHVTCEECKELHRAARAAAAAQAAQDALAAEPTGYATAAEAYAAQTGTPVWTPDADAALIES